MFIPQTILTSKTILSQEAKLVHQNFAKKYSIISKKSKPQISDEEYVNSLTEIPSVQLQKDIFNWFFSLDTPTRIKVSTIYNKWNTSILSQLLMLYFFKMQITVKLSDKMSIDYYESSSSSSNNLILKQHFYNNEDIECFLYYYKVLEQQSTNINDDTKEDDSKEQESFFIQMIKYITINESNDAICLSHFFVAQNEKFRTSLLNISKNKIFTSWINFYQEEDTKMFNFSLQEWIKCNQSFSITQIILSYFEHIIQLNYQYYYYTKKLYDFPYFSKITEILDLNSKLELFLKIEQIDNVLKDIDLDDITLKLKSNATIKKEMNKYQKSQETVCNFFFNSATLYFRDSFCNKFVYEIYNNLRKECQKSIKSFIDLISLIEPKSVFNSNVFVYNKIYDYIHHYYVDKNLDDLLTDSLNKDCNKSKKRNNKKKKKKKEKEENEEKNKNVNEKQVKNSINIIEDKEIQMGSAITNNNTIEEMKDREETQSGKEEIASNSLSNQIENTMKDENKIKYNDNDNSCTSLNKKKKNKHKTEIYLYSLKPEKKKPKSSDECTNEILTKAKENKVKNDIILPEAKSCKNEVQSDSLSIINTNAIIKEDNKDNNQQPFIEQKQEKTKKENSKELEGVYHPIKISPINNNISHQPKHIYTPNINSYYPELPFHPSKQSSIFSYNQSYYHQSDTIYKALSNEIYSFNTTVTKNIEALKPYKDKYKIKIENIIKQTLEQKYNFRITYFGSYVSNLALENSDIDILLIYKSKSNDHIGIDTIINELVYSFQKNKELFNYINPIYTASIPVIKLQCDFIKDIDKDLKQLIENEYLFDKSELCTVKFDLSFKEENDGLFSIPSQNVLVYIRDSLVLYPDIQALISVIKRFMQKERLNSSFKGGISSFSLFLMVLSFYKLIKKPLKNNNDVTIGQVLFCLMEFYGTLNYSKYVIDSKQDNPFILNELVMNGPNVITILDPITGLNVAKTSFKIEEIKNAFIKGSNYFRQKTYEFIPISNGSLLIGLFNS